MYSYDIHSLNIITIHFLALILAKLISVTLFSPRFP